RAQRSRDRRYRERGECEHPCGVPSCCTGGKERFSGRTKGVPRACAVARHPCLCPSRVVCITPRKAQACFLGKITQLLSRVEREVSKIPPGSETALCR